MALLVFIPLSMACQEQYETGKNVTIIDVIESNGGNATCDIQIYNQTGIMDSGTMLQTGLQYRYVISDITRGSYSASINCTKNVTNYYIGECKFKVKEEDNMIIAVLILIPILLSGVLLWGASMLDAEVHKSLRTFLFIFSIIPFFASLHFGLISVVKFYDFPELQNLIGTSTYWIGAILAVILFYFLIYIFYTMVTHAKEQRDTRYD